jgi:hypothetical protein
MQASIRPPGLTNSLETAQGPGASATPAGVPETTPYRQRFGLFGGEG